MGRVSRLRARGLTVRERWKQAIPYESTFWEDWLATRAFGNEEEYDARLDPRLPVSEYLLAGKLEAIREQEISILDVGAGPLTTVGRTYKGKQLTITAIDPLAADYDRILESSDVVPPVRTRLGEGERLLELFPAGSFDVAYSANALDHSYDPLLVIRNMVDVVKPGGYVLLRHRRNEAEAKGYLGLHQWNFDIKDGRFVVWNREGAHDLGRTLGRTVEMSAFAEENEVCCVLRRPAATSPSDSS